MTISSSYQGAYKAVSYMIETGCRRVAFYGSNMNMEISKNRFNGYKDALYHHGLKPEEELIRQCDTREAAEELTPLLLRMKNRPDGFFAINDETAIGIMYTAKRMGMKVPDEVAVCGFTDSERAISCDPMLTTVKQNGQEVGAQAVDVLINLVEGNLPMDRAEKRMVRTQLVVRGTTR